MQTQRVFLHEASGINRDAALWRGVAACLRLRRHAATAVAGLAIVLCPVSLHGQTITFSAIGDVPYSDSELPVLQQHMVNHNLYSNAEFMVHVGDIFSGGTPCEEYRYQQVSDVLKTLAVPAFMVPGDNETTDCDDPIEAMAFWRNHFQELEDFYCSSLGVQRQTARMENFAFVSKGVLFIGIHLVGGSNPSALQQDDANWIQQHLQQQAPFVRAAVIFAQAEPGSGSLLESQFLANATAFAKPVLYLHGNGHSWIDDYPYPAAPNVRRIQVERGDEPPIAVTVSTDPLPVFQVNRNPFSGAPFNMTPCVHAGPDLAISVTQQAWLRGRVDDDRDPGSAALAITWSKSSGPGTVTFTSPNAEETLASFSANGTYSLRLRATDGVLTATDFVTVAVADGTPNQPPIANNDSYAITMGQTLTVPAPGILGNDVDPNSTALTASRISGPSNGTLTLNANGSFTYTPLANFYGTDAFTYRASDGTFQSAPANVVLNVVPVTLTLQPQHDTQASSTSPTSTFGGAKTLRVELDATSYRSFLKFSVNGTGSTIYSAKLRLYVSNSSPDGGSLYRVSNYFPGTTTAWTEGTLNWQNMPLMTGAPLGTLGSVSNGEFVQFDVTAAIKGDGIYSFGIQNASSNALEYSSKEGDEAPVLVIETRPGGGGTNSAPVAQDNLYSVAEDAVLNLAAPGVLGNDSDANGDAMTVLLTSAPAHGSATLGPNGGFTYTPVANYHGPDAFTYVADDNRGGLDAATVTLNVTPVNDLPVAVDEAYGTNEDVPLSVPAPGVLANDTDIDADVLAAQVAVGPSHGTLILNGNGSFTYTPAADYHGADAFTYTVADGKGGSDVGMVTLTIQGVEDAPRAGDDAYSTNEDQFVSIVAPGVLGNDSDPEGDALEVGVGTLPAQGTLALDPGGGFIYSPAADYHGTDSFTYVLFDAKGGTDTGTVTLTVVPVNDTPVASADVYATDEDTPIAVPAPGVLANDEDIDGDVLTASIVTPPAHGSLTLAPDGGFTYAPAADYNGGDSFTYAVGDGHGGSANATVTLGIRAQNDAPRAGSDSWSTSEDSALNVAAPGVLGNDVDVDGDPLSVAPQRLPAHGTLTLAANGSFTYVPDADYNGADDFTYTLSDGRGGTATGTVQLDIEPTNDAPVAAADAYGTSEDVALVVAAPGVLGNDADIDADGLGAAVSVPPLHGNLVLAANGGFTYTPHADYHGSDHFEYIASDGNGGSDASSVSLDVASVNDAPSAVADTYSGVEDAPIVVAAPGVLGNDTDVDGDALTVEVATPPAHGLLSLAADGSFTYSPADDFNGPDAFTYTVRDGAGGAVTATVTLAVAAVNDAPVAGDDAYVLDEDTPLVMAAPGLQGNDGDIDGDPLVTTVATPPAHGTLVLGADGGFTYTPTRDYVGADSFTYTLRDTKAASDMGVVTLTVRPVNDLPVAAGDSYTTSEDVALVVGAPGLLGNDADVDGDALGVSVLDPPDHGTLLVGPNGEFTYTPAPDFHGSDAFVYGVDDGHGGSASASVGITVTPVNDNPVAGDDTYATDEDTPLTLATPGVLGNDADIDGDALTVTVASPPAHGVLALDAGGGFTYTPAPNYAGADAFTYTLRDAAGATDSGRVTLAIRAVNDAPVTGADAYVIDEDTALVIAAPGVLANDSDAEGEALVVTATALPLHGSLVLAANGGFTYTPDADYNGTDAFTYEARDPTGAYATGTVSLGIVAQNDAPMAADDDYVTDEDIGLDIPAPGVLANDDDVDGDNLTLALQAVPDLGALVLRNDGGFSYMPGPNFNGTDVFSYTLRDPSGSIATGIVTMTVRPVNDAPLAAGDAYGTREDVVLTVAAPGVLGNDVDVEGDALTAAVAVAPAQGLLSLEADGSFTYTPGPDFHGNDAFTYRVRDVHGATSTGTVDLTVAAVNDAPLPADDDYTVDEDQTLPIPAPGLLGNDTDVEGDALTAVLLTPPSRGQAQLEADGSFTYTPDPDAFGTDTFTYEARDGNGGSSTATASFTVRPVNDAPAVNADAFETDEDTALTVGAPGVLANDTDVDGDALVARVSQGPEHGTLQLGGGGGFTYTPAADYNGPDAFTYVADDGHGGETTATVTLTVTAVNDPPVGAADLHATDEDQVLVVAAPGVLGNDTDVDGGALVASVSQEPGHGSLELGADGGFTYTPAPDFNGLDAFTYRIDDGAGGSSEAGVSLSVRPVADAPAARGDTYAVDEDDILMVATPGVLANDVDVDGDSLRARLLGGPAHGSFLFEASGAFRYVPDPDWNGTDTFTYAADDSSGRSGTAQVTLVVSPVNDSPFATPDHFSLDEDEVLSIASPGVLTNDGDLDGDVLQAAVTTHPAHGTVVLDGAGSFTYTPALDYNGTDSFAYAVDDGGGGSATASVTLAIAAVNDAPRPGADAYSVAEDDTLRVQAPGLLGNDLDAEGDPTQAALVTAPAHGDVSLSADGGFTYVPAPDFTGADGFIYAASDPFGAKLEGSVVLHVLPVNDAPTAVADSFSVLAGDPFVSDAPGLLVNDVDIDGDSLVAAVAVPPLYGDLHLQAGGGFTYVAHPGFTGRDSFTYEASDGSMTDRATVVVQVEGRGVTYRESASGGGEQTSQVTAAGNLRPVAQDLYVAAISTRPRIAVSAVTGMGMQWSRVRSQCGARGESNLEVWMARGEPTPGEIQAHFAAVVERAALVVSRYSGADATDPLGSVSSRNSAGEDCTSGDDSDGYALDVTTLTEGGIVYVALGTGDVEHETASGLFGRMRAAQGSACVEVHDRAEDAGLHTVTGRFTGSVDWTAVAMEIRSRHVDEGLRSTATLDVRPNPFNSTAHIGYTLYRRAHVELSIFDARGLLVRRLWKGGVAPGRLQLEWDARDDRGLPVQSGVYFLRLQSDGRTLARKVVLLK